MVLTNCIYHTARSGLKRITVREISRLYGIYADDGQHSGKEVQGQTFCAFDESACIGQHRRLML